MSKPYKIIYTIQTTEVEIFDADGNSVEEYRNDDVVVMDEVRVELSEDEMNDYDLEEN